MAKSKRVIPKEPAQIYVPKEDKEIYIYIHKNIKKLFPIPYKYTLDFQYLKKMMEK